MQNRNKIWAFSIFVLLSCLAATSPSGIIEVNTTSVNFGTIPVGQGKSQTITVTNRTSRQLRFTYVATRPFGSSPTSHNLAGGQSATVTVSVPPATAAGTYSGNVTIRAFEATGTQAIDGIRVALAAVVQPAVPTSPDLTIPNIALASQEPVNGNRRVLIRLTLKSSSGDVTARTKAFARIGTQQEQLAYENASSIYTLAGTLQQFEVFLVGQNQTITYTVRAVADSDNQIAESNEGNNEKAVILTLPPLQ